jgi:hydroxymethylpyrimidine/phosphomethylpyrimidine kinase
MKTALTIAGSDSCGGAGIQADLKTFSVLGVYGMSAITAVTAQNTLGVKDAVEILPDLVRKQIDVAAGDIQVDACKTGMLSSAAIIDVVEDAISRNKLFPYVCDPVMVAKSGSQLLKKDAVEAMKRRLFPIASVVTPNRHETAALTGASVDVLTSVAAAKDAARRIVDMGAQAVVVKGIMLGNQAVDVFFDGREFFEFAEKLQPVEESHGSGCAFSAAITAGLANRKTLVEAIDLAKQLVTMAIQYSDGQGRGTAPVNVLAFAAKKK